MRTQWRAFEEAREYARGLGLQTRNEWTEWAKTAERPADIPADARGVYAADWRGWRDWLGTEQRPASRRQTWRPFEKAREYTRRLGLQSRSEWAEWAKLAERPDDIPATPSQVYKVEWRGWRDWLGTEDTAHSRRQWRSFEDARKYTQSLGLSNVDEWRRWGKSGQRPDDIPADPANKYDTKLAFTTSLCPSSGHFVRSIGQPGEPDGLPHSYARVMQYARCVLPRTPLSESSGE